MAIIFLSSDRKTSYELSDMYLMILGFILSYYATKKCCEFIKRIRELHKLKKKQMEFRGGDDLVGIILHCVEDDHFYQVIDNQMKKIIFAVLRENIETESLILSPNLIRLVAEIIKNQVSYETNPVVTIFKGGMVLVDNSGRTKIRGWIACYICGLP